MKTTFRVLALLTTALLFGCGKEETKIPTVNSNEPNKTADHGKSVPNKGEKGGGMGKGDDRAVTGAPAGGFKQGE